MKTDLTPQIVSLDRLSGGVVVTFEDGVSALYSPAILRAILSHPRPKTMSPVKDKEAPLRC